MNDYEQYINILLNYKLNYKDIDIMILVSLFDYIGYFDAICKLINEVYNHISFDDYILLIEYITDKENILTNIDYQKIVTLYITKCINLDRFDLSDTKHNKYINVDNMKLNDNIKYIKLLEFVYITNGDKILSGIDITKFMIKNI